MFQLEVQIWLDREDRVSKIVVDGERIDKKVRFKFVFNYWIRDSITIYEWDNGFDTNVITFKALFEIVMSADS